MNKVLLCVKCFLNCLLPFPVLYHSFLLNSIDSHLQIGILPKLISTFIECLINFTFSQNENSYLKSIDISQNRLEDEGIMYLSFGFKQCMHLNSLVKGKFKLLYKNIIKIFAIYFSKNVSSNGLSEYGLRILTENLNYEHLKYLNLSGK